MPYPTTRTFDIDAELQSLEAYVATGAWDSLERAGREVCALHAGDERTERAAAVDLSGYHRALQIALQHAKQRCTPEVQAIYFEYDLDNDWQGNLFLCQEYGPLEEGDDDWACDWLDEVAVPGMPDLAELYGSTFDRTPADGAANLFLIARTIAIFGRASEQVDFGGRAVCAAFHDQDPITGVIERGGWFRAGSCSERGPMAAEEARADGCEKHHAEVVPSGRWRFSITLLN